MDTITHDRGLGSAYERYHFYRLIEGWAERYGIESVLEGPFDGMAGIPSVHGVGLARRGLRVTSLVTSEEQRLVSQGVYDRAAPGAGVVVRTAPSEGDLANVAPHDLVIVYHAFSLVPDWRGYVARMAKLATKALVVTVCNPDNWGVAILRAFGSLRGTALAPPESWRTDVLGPELWKLGRVREHEYFDCPWWPDLQVAAGQSLLDRTKKLFSRRLENLTETSREANLAKKFVYGTERWPYFGDDGFDGELGPALERHPDFEATRFNRLKERTGHLHAFLVDVQPRTETARRRLNVKRDAG